MTKAEEVFAKYHRLRVKEDVIQNIPILTIAEVQAIIDSYEDQTAKVRERLEELVWLVGGTCDH